MKILLVVNYRPNSGSLSGAVDELKSGLEREGYQCTLGSTFGSFLYRVFSIFVILFKSVGADIIIANGSAFRGYFPIVISKIVSLITFKPLLINFHDGQAPVFLKKHQKKIRFLNRNDIFIAASKFVRDCFVEYGVRCKVIEYSFNFNKNFPKRGREFSWNNKFIWVRGFHPIYQPEFALNAATKFLEKGGKGEFYFLGAGYLRDSLVNKYKQNGIIFLDKLGRNELLKKYEEFPVLINTSAYDNFPLSVVEAGFYNMLVISTKIGGIPTIYSENELVFFDTEEELTGILFDIIKNPERYDLFRNNLNRKVNTFLWSNVRLKWIKTINTCVESAA